MINKWAIIIEIGKNKIAPIRIKRGVYQGDSMSPLLFILISACIMHAIRNNEEITRASRVKQEIAAFMDDCKGTCA